MAFARRASRYISLVLSILASSVLLTALLTIPYSSPKSNSQHSSSELWHEAIPWKLVGEGNYLHVPDERHDGLAREPPSNDVPLEERRGHSDTELERRIDLFSSRALRKLKKKSQQFQCWLDGAPGVPPTKYVQYQDLASWGWTLDRQNDKDYEHVAQWLDTAPDVNIGDMTHGVGMSWKHALDSKNGGMTYPATNAMYYNAFYPSTPSGGVILANDNKSPDYMIQKKLTPATFTADTPRVPLKSWSDVIFLSWASLTTADERKDLRFVLRRVITNDATLDNLKKIMKAKGFKDGQAPVWPGVVVDADTNGWYLLLASPNVSGVCWLLLQHKAELGAKTIKGIRVFNEYPKGSYGPSMVIELADKGS